MKTFVEPDVDTIQRVWNWCSETYLRHGRVLNFPANTDPQKTYQWRYLKSIAKKFNEWDFDDATAMRFIDIAVQHAKSNGVLHKGLAALHQSNMLQVCYNALQDENNNNIQSIASLRTTKAWLDKQLYGPDHIKMLLSRQHADALCNIVVWYQSMRLTRLFLSLSKICTRAMNTLAEKAPDQRNLLPPSTQLYLIRTEFLQNIGNVREARKILGTDWKGAI